MKDNLELKLVAVNFFFVYYNQHLLLSYFYNIVSIFCLTYISRYAPFENIIAVLLVG